MNRRTSDANRKTEIVSLYEDSVSPAGFAPATPPPRTECSSELSYGLTEPSLVAIMERPAGYGPAF